MSAAVETESDTIMFCASCGTAGGSDITLKRCNACYLVRYCSVKCQKDHRPQHKKECKKRAAELKDEILFKQPESCCFCDCPICCLPLPIDNSKSTLTSCCSKLICNGCTYANQKREIRERLEQKCPFCRKAVPKTDEQIYEQRMKRIEANDPLAMSQLGKKKYYEGNYTAAFEYWSRAAALGDADAHLELSITYQHGEGVEKDEKKMLHHAEQAAIRGHPIARHNLGWFERENGRYDRAAKHWIIASKLGHDDSLEEVKSLHKDGHVSKEDFAAALRGHHAAIKATESDQREAAYAYKLQAASMS